MIPALSLESAIATSPIPPRVVRFGVFEVDLDAGEVRKAGLRQKLVGQPFQVLQALLEHPGEIVTREELRQRLWPDNTFVDYELALKKAVNRLREVLGDSADSPRFIETIPRRGYRFIGSIASPSLPAESSEQAAAEASAPTESSRHNRAAFFRRLIATFVLLAIAGSLLWFNADKLRTRIFARSRSAEIHSIAVLPFKNLSSNPEQEYFSDGMTDELTTDLAKSSGLLVISHTSVERYRDTKLPLRAIAGELGVEAVVEGSVMRSGDRVRITAQLIDTRTDRHLWAESYERDLRDVLAMQDQLARRITNAVGVKLSTGRQTLGLNGRSLNAAAYEAYLKGNFYWNRLTCDGFKRGQEYFQQAADQDASFALAYVGLAQSYFTLWDWGCMPTAEMAAKSKAAALRAIELDPDLGEAHAWLGKLLFFYERDWTETEEQLMQAIELNPNYEYAHLIYAVFLVARGRQEQGFAEMRRALELDPTSELTNVVSTFALYLAHEFDHAIEQGKRTVELYPNSPSPYIWLAASYEEKGMYDEAFGAYLRGKSFEGVSAPQLAALRRTYETSGIRGYWRHELDIAKANTPIDACWTATIFSHLGDKERALDSLNRALQQHCSGLHLLNVDPLYDGLRRDPGFQELLHRLRM